MEEAAKVSPKVEALLASLIDIQVKVDDRLYNLLIPNGVSFEEAHWVCEEMGRLVMQLKEKNAADKALQPEVVG